MQENTVSIFEKRQKKKTIFYMTLLWKYKKLRLFLGATALTALVTYTIDRSMNRIFDGKKEVQSDQIPQCVMPSETGIDYTYTLECPKCDNTVTVSFKSKKMPFSISCSKCNKIMMLSLLSERNKREK